eukprot:GHRQ01014539.1.p1 GENE.GHRQ01014539.1~~GHRQ01014539.1.p1  ORF type:complete len:173 (-),score=47.16 GHRQ01014539.1:84-602(-)
MHQAARLQAAGHMDSLGLQFIIRQCSPERLSQQLFVLAAVARQLRGVVQAHDGARAVAAAERLQAVCCAQLSQRLADEVHLRGGSSQVADKAQARRACDTCLAAAMPASKLQVAWPAVRDEASAAREHQRAEPAQWSTRALNPQGKRRQTVGPLHPPRCVAATLNNLLKQPA